MTPLLLAALLLAEPGELLREELFNYLVAGELPRGWEREGKGPSYRFSIEGVPHGHLSFVRERLPDPVDLAATMRKRAALFRFHETPEEAKETITETVWGGQPALLYELSFTLRGVPHRRRVLAMQAKSIWYELYETVFGDAEAESAYLEGRRLFIEGFRLLAPPLGREAGEGPEEIADRELGYRILRPRGFLRIDPDPVRDPGCRVAFEGRGERPAQRLLVRLFEYGRRPRSDLTEWMSQFFGDFARRHDGAQRTPSGATVPGAEEVVAERFSAKGVSAAVWFLRDREGRVFCLQVRSDGGADEALKEPLAAILGSLAIGR